MKLKKSLFLFSLSLLMLSQMAYLKVQAVTSSGVILQQQLNVPATQGTNTSFSLSQPATVTLTVTANQSTPALNVYLLYPDNYAMYKLTGSLANTTPLKPFTASNTLSYTASGLLSNGSYGLVIQWAQTSNATNVSVDVKVTAQQYIAPSSK